MSTTEGSGKLLNYMAMGIPTVAFDVPVSREYLGDLGIYAQPGDTSSLALALETALDRKDASQALVWHCARESFSAIPGLWLAKAFLRSMIGLARRPGLLEVA